MTTYIKYCWRCKELNSHKIIRVGRTKGVKLQCLMCGKINRRWMNVNQLIPFIENNERREKTI